MGETAGFNRIQIRSDSINSNIYYTKKAGIIVNIKLNN
jgi:hypothetical protein